MIDEEDEGFDHAAHKRLLQDLKRQVMRKVDAVQDEVLLQAVLEMLTDAEIDFMDGEKDPELVEASEIDLEHPDNRRKPAPINQKNKNNADSWLDGLGR
jgi:hypothetical protein